MPVAEQVVPGGAACGCLEVGDVLLAVGARPGGATAASPSWCTSFLQLEELLDARPALPVWVAVQRGGQTREVELLVEDLHALSATRLLEVGGCVLHELSYQQARNWNIKPGAVHVAFAGAAPCPPSRHSALVGSGARRVRRYRSPICL